LGSFNQTLGKYLVGSVIGAAILVGGFLAPVTNSAGRVLAADTTCPGQPHCTATANDTYANGVLTPSGNTSILEYPKGCDPSLCPVGLVPTVQPPAAGNTKPTLPDGASVTIVWNIDGTFTVRVVGSKGQLTDWSGSPIVLTGLTDMVIQEYIPGANGQPGTWVTVTGIAGVGPYRLAPGTTIPVATPVPTAAPTAVPTKRPSPPIIHSNFPAHCTGVCSKSFGVTVPPADKGKVNVSWHSNGSFTVSVTRVSGLKLTPVNVPKGDVLQVYNARTKKWTTVKFITGPGMYRLHKK